MGGARASSRARGAAIALAIFALLAGVAALRREALAGWIAERLLASRGMHASLAVTRLGTQGAVLAPLRLETPGAPSVTAERVELSWSFGGLLARRLDHIVASGVRVEGRIELPELGASDAASDASTRPAPIAFPAIPAHSLALRDLAIELDTSAGHVSLHGGGAALFAVSAVAGALSLSGETPYGAVDAKLALAGTRAAPEARFDVIGTPRSAALPVPIQAPLRATGRLYQDPAGSPRWKTQATLPWLEWPERARLEEIAVDAEGDLRALRATLRVARAIDLRKPALLAPVSLELTLDGPFEALAFEGRSRTLDGGYTCELRGTLEPFAQSADVSFRVPETQVGEKARQPKRLSPQLGTLVQQAKGFLGATGRARVAKGKLSYQADVAFRGLDLRTPSATLRGLTGAVTFEGPPLTTPPGQLVSIAAIEEPLPLADGLVQFQLTRDNAVQLESVVFAAAKGELRASGRWPLDAEERSIELVAKDLDIATLLAALPFETLSGTGTLEGTLPLRQRGARVRIENGTLRATRAGVLRYRSQAGGAAATGKQKQLATVIGALENLHYDMLELDISGDTAEALNVAVRIAGNNPDFQQGRPVRLNLNVEAHLGDLVKVGRAAYRVPEQVEQRVKQVLDREKR